MLQLSDFYYSLPKKLIAQKPLKTRDASRMLVLNSQSGDCGLRKFIEILDYLKKDDCLVFNDTEVIPARILGEKIPTGAKIEILLLEETSRGCWKAMIKPGKRVKSGTIIKIDKKGRYSCSVKTKNDDGTYQIELNSDDLQGIFDKYAHIPLPPYIFREDTENDKKRYQTVYAKNPGAVAAPTAGLHFSGNILSKIRELGCHTAHVTLHVGPGTFQPVKVDNLSEHKMHEERFLLSKKNADIINKTKANGGRIIAIGTTSVRVLESCADKRENIIPQTGRTDIFIYPPYKMKIVDALLTNFHLPKSTLLMLVSALAGRENIMNAYNLAVKNNFRFYSYGDCMLIL
ncbi:MAG: tRNA preQ1(34) S-adenosylmethionine ribosyltransferase-isomerase QueA [Verrucomicrobiota bacterium]|nr:tRNA preQ1(34) S-adenosylmethionine ribosyltransferase-isomerase QueA [Verrucomicrobiota bacterium]